MTSWVENDKLGGEIKVGGEYQGGWKISMWVENIKVGGEIKLGGNIKVGGE